jgi:predicted nucleotidyltransferase
VEFLPGGDFDAFRDYFDLLDGLQKLFGRKVDLVMPGAIRNPHLMQAVERQRQPVYAA